MRLIHSTTLQLEEFTENDILQYVILSHAWGAGEVTFQDICNRKHTKLAREKPLGWSKIKNCCDITKSAEIGYCWVDTCSIDKKSSAELSEAINSMFKWYRDATYCVAYLSDVSGSDLEEDETQHQFRRSRWFTRGWTLQELLAPAAVWFFNGTWQFLGSKYDYSALVEEITGISENVLHDPGDIFRTNIARRMSWAAMRQTTRTKDLAYSLMGIFQVNMPLLYGEGERAFIRLQEEIIKESDDKSIFAWSPDPDEGPRADLDILGILARHPKCFVNSGKIETVLDQNTGMSITNRGLSIRLPVLESSDPGHFLAVLSCSPLEVANSIYQDVDLFSIMTLKVTTGSGVLGRVPGAPLGMIRESFVLLADLHDSQLAKLDATMPRRTPRRSIEMKVVDNDKFGWTLKSTLYAFKPLTVFTSYHSWQVNQPGYLFTLPPNGVDCIAAFHIAHAATFVKGIVVLLESRGNRLRWYRRLVPFGADDSLTQVLQENLGMNRMLQDELYENVRETFDFIGRHVFDVESLQIKRFQPIVSPSKSMDTSTSTQDCTIVVEISKRRVNPPQKSELFELE